MLFRSGGGYIAPWLYERLLKEKNMLEITEEQRRDLLTYLAKRPFVEVTALIAMLASLRLKKEDNKNDSVTSKK